MVRFLYWLLFWCHIVSCASLTIAWNDLETELNGEEYVRVWLKVGLDQDPSDRPYMYLHCFAFAWCTLTGWVGEYEPQTPVQDAWMLANMIVGVFTYMYIFGEIVSIMQNFDLTSASFNARRDMVNTFLTTRQVPNDVKLRVHSYFEALWSHKKGMEENTVLDSLPEFLRHDLSYHLNKQFLDKVPMFIGADSAALMEINRYLVHEVVTAGEFIIRAGELGRSIYFVISGSLVILDDEGHSKLNLFEGSVVGEVAVLLNIPQPHSVRAMQTSDVFSLAVEDYFDLELSFPAMRRKLARRAKAVYGADWDEWSGCKVCCARPLLSPKPSLPCCAS